MASTNTESWGQSNPSTAFLLKCAREKEKLRSRLHKELQQEMLYMLEEGLYTDLQLGLNSSVTNLPHLDTSVPHTLSVHKAVLQVRTPAFLTHVLKNKEVHNRVTSYSTNLGKAELQQFLKKVYTDDDIRRHECEVLRLSKTYGDIFRDGKNLFNKHIFDSDDFERESLNSENFVTPKSSPVTPERCINFTDMMPNNQVKGKNAISEGPLKLNTNTQKDFFTKSKNPEQRSQKELSDSEVDIRDVECASGFKSAVLYNSTDISSTSIEIDESDFLLEDVCSSSVTGEMTKPSTSEFEESNLPIDSEGSVTTSGMVRSGTFDLHTQAPLEDYIDDNQVVDTSSRVDSSSNVLSSSVPSQFSDDGTSFFLHDPPQKLNLFKNPSTGDSCHFNNNDNPLSNSCHFPRIDGSITDSGFMSYSTYSMLSDNGLPNSFSSSLVVSSDTPFSPDNVWKLNEDIMHSSLESSSKFSGSMFPFYIDINNLPENRQSKSSAISHEDIPKNLSEFFERNDRQARIDEKFKSRDHRIRCREQLTKAQSSPHLDIIKDASSIRRPRPRSCYMYIDLDTVQTDKKEDGKDKRAPSSVSMFVDLKEDGNDSSVKEQNLNFSESTKEDSKLNTKTLGSAFEINMMGNVTDKQKRKLSDSFLQAHDPGFSGIGYCSLRRPEENRSDSALNNIIVSNISKLSLNNPYHIHKSRSMSKSPDVVNTYSLKKHITSKWMSSDSEKDDIRTDDCERFSEGQTSTTLLNNIIHVEKRPSNNLGQDVSKKHDFMDEAGLLPMSPILRRKCQNKEIQKQSPHPTIIKASTKPQDISAMTFPRPDKGTYKLLDEEKLEQSEGTSKKVNSDDNTEYENFIEKSFLESVSRSESSAPSMSVDTSSSGKLIIAESNKDGNKSPLSFSLPYEFEDDSETVYSEVSDLSSSLGSMSGVASLEQRWRESAKKDGAMHNIYRILEACSKLGEDLLCMFLEEIDTDVVVATEGKSIKAHRCILASRCKYFATILKGPDFAESGVINLQGFSYASVHFALCHIYSGALNPPKDPNILELSLLADVLHMDSLVDVLVLHLKTHYCHFFHKPCAQCIHGVLECLPLALNCGFVLLRDKCVRWLGKYFTRTWPYKGFATLPEDLREFCFQSAVKGLTIETVIEITLNCDRLITTLPHLKWSEPIFGLVTRLLQECIHFMADNFDRILCSEGFLVLGKGQSWNVTTLEDDIVSAVELMTPDIACKSSVKLSQILSLAESKHSEYGEFTQNFIDLLHKVNRHCERHLIHNANKVVHCQSWACLSPEVQKRIRDAAVIVFEFEKATAKPPRLSSLQKKLKKQRDDDDESVFFESATYPKSIKNGASKFPVDVSEHNVIGKKLVSPITEESQCHGVSLRKEVHDLHDEDSLKEMLELPHDHSQNISQQSSSAGLLESEENHSGTQCSDNPDSLDAHEELMSDSKDDIDCSLLAAEDISHDDKLFGFKSIDSKDHNSNNDQNVTTKIDQDSNENYYLKPDVSQSSDNEKMQKNAKNLQKSPLKSLVPLPKSLHLQDKEAPCKDLVAEIDADSRMVTHCLQEAEMLEQQLSRKLLHQQQVVMTPTKLFNSSAADSRRTVINRVQKSVATSRGKSPGKLTPSPSSPQVPRLLRTSESNVNAKNINKKSPSPKVSLLPGQRSFRIVEGVNVTRQISPAKRVSTRITKPKSSDNRAPNQK